MANETTEKTLEQESLSDVQKEIALMIKMLDEIYKNKSSDEYKMMGDITKSIVYEEMERQVANLKTLRNFPKAEAEDYQRMFDNLHKPMYKKLVMEFNKAPNEKNTTFTALFTVGYRVLIGDLAKIYASTEATEAGIVYLPDKVKGVNQRSRAFIHDFTKNLEEEYNKVVRMKGNRPKMHQEYALLNTLGSAATALATFIQAHELVPVTSFLSDVVGGIFGHRKELNPISYINDRLTQRYDDYIERFKDTEKLYNATKEAYEEYKSQPGRKSFGVQGRYISNMKKYQLQMLRLKAHMAHYDSRGEAKRKEELDRLRLEKRQKRKEEREAKRAAKRAAKEQTKQAPSTLTKPKPEPPSHETSPEGSPAPKPEPKPEPAPKPKPVDTGDLDF